MITLRPYQETGLSELRNALKRHRSTIYVLPCGGGKGTVVSAMVRGATEKQKNIIFAVHGIALVHDMSRRLARLDIPHGVLVGGSKRERCHSVQVASIDTLHRMAEKPPADLIILDEARTFLSATGRRVIEDYPHARIVGMDATPARLDGKGLGAAAGGIFESLVMGPPEQALIDMGYLVPSIPLGIPDPPDLSGVRKTAGEFNQKQLAAACDKVKLVGNIVEHWLAHARNRKTIAFGVDQAHARHIADQFIAAGIEWAYVDANTPDAEREAIWERLDHGTLMGISNVMIAGVGWDHPIVSCIVAARPTASLTLWRQMMGRGSRIHPESGKKDFLILDHANNIMRHYPHGWFELPPQWTLDGAVKKKAEAKDAEMQVAMCKIPVLVPASGVPATFTGPVANGYMLPSFHSFQAGPAACPYCGLPFATNKRKIATEAGDLKDLSALRASALLDGAAKPESARKSEYIGLVKIAKARGYKPGYPGMMFKSKFGYWPPRGWKQDAAALS